MSGPERIQRQDEILQLMYWMRGEGLGQAVQPGRIAQFVALSEPEITATLHDLLAAGLVQDSDSKGFSLTELGVTEAGRRFAEEFSPYLGQEGHLECNDPNCDCHSPEFSGVCRNV